MDKVHFSTGKDDWGTPQELFDALNREFGFTLDPCADDNNHKCAKYYTKEQNGLAQSWAGETVFCNPPYSRKTKAYGWSTSSILRIHHAKDRLELQKEQRTYWKMPITEEERIEARRRCRIGDEIMVFNHWKSKKKEVGYGIWEISRIKGKFRYIVLLENGRTVDYAEVARQRRGGE